MSYQVPFVRFASGLCALFALAMLINLGCGCGGEDTTTSTLVKPPLLTRPTPDLFAQVQTKLPLAYRAIQEGDHQTAIAYFEDIVGLVPDYPMTYYHMAFCQAVMGDPDEAMELLKKATDRGYCDPEPILMLHQFKDVVALGDWKQVRDRMLENRKPFWGPKIASYQELDPALEPDFSGLDSLKTVFIQQVQEVQQLVYLHPETKVRLHIWNVLNHRIAALRKYELKGLDEQEQLQVDREILSTVTSYEESSRSPWLASTVQAIIKESDEFIAKYKDNTEEAAQAAYIQARAKWYGQRPMDQKDQTDQHVKTAQELFTSVYDRYPGAMSSLLAMMDAMTIVSDHHGFGDPALQGYVAVVDSVYGDNQMMQGGQLGIIFSSIKSAVDYTSKGLPDFTVTDMDGKEWRSTDLGGKVVLIDFWATWCSPCRKELPNLVRLYEQYKDQGFEILGISLDYSRNMDNEKLKEWMKENNVTWPTVFDGKDWSGSAVKACGIKSIPFPILIGKDGQVIAAGQMAKGVGLHKLLAKQFN
jgi:thiol-disulfide isomerase/thioredoxin/tetratricopeptide (TPR) repeat protein